MWKDPIVEEVRQVREEHAEKFAHDLRAIYEDLKATEKQGGRRVVSLLPKRSKPRESEAFSSAPPSPEIPGRHPRQHREAR
jgi:hypothetical protein